jgi:hypothetical protein
MRRSVRNLIAVVTLAVAAPSAASAQSIDQFNVGQPLTGALFGTDTFGWFYTPSVTFALTGVRTQFAALPPGETDRAVTVELFATTGGTDLAASPLASASFLAAGAIGALGGAAFAGTTLDAGQTYFIGFRNVFALGANLTSGPTRLAAVRFGDFGAEYGFLASVGDFEDEYFQPTLAIDGRTIASPVPEPGTVVLLATGLLAVAGATRRRARR